MKPGASPLFADLHLHSRFSDGTWDPDSLAARAAELRLAAIALTDHDTVEGCAAAAAACQRHGLEFIPATELTAEVDGAELHLLAYFVDTANPLLLREMQRFQNVRQQRVREMVRRINALGVPLSTERVLALADCHSPGRPHVGRALVQEGYCASVEEAFDRFLRKGKPAWVPKARMSAATGIELIHQAGGLAVLAHPGLSQVDPLLPLLQGAGLDGLECYHPKHGPSQTTRYLELATERGLLVTGGSDCHGLAKGKPLIGTVTLPFEHLERFRAARRGMAPRSAIAPPASPDAVRA
jgi:hypothetical protein